MCHKSCIGEVTDLTKANIVKYIPQIQRINIIGNNEITIKGIDKVVLYCKSLELLGYS